jgi:hypothetical protein
LDQVFLQILLFSTVSFMFLVYNQLGILSVLPLKVQKDKQRSTKHIYI